MVDAALVKARSSPSPSASTAGKVTGWPGEHLAERLDLESSLAEIATIAQAKWAEGVRIEIEVGPDLPILSCDRDALQSAMMHLMLNARDAMPAGGVVLISAQATALDSGSTGVELRVTDSGVGMKPDTIDRAFDPFFTTKPDGLGGIGLPIVSRFADEVGGRVVMESKFGFGTSVRLQIPSSFGGGEIPERREPTTA